MKTLSRHNVFSGRIIKVYNDQVEMADGTLTTREVVSHREAVAVIAVNEKGELLLVTQYRYPIKRDMLELPAGLIDPGESPLEAAKRELREETGYEAAHWELLTSTYSSPGSHDEKIHIFMASDLRLVSEQDLDADEELTCSILPFDQVLIKVKSGVIKDGKTIIGVLLYWVRQQELDFD